MIEKEKIYLSVLKDICKQNGFDEEELASINIDKISIRLESNNWYSGRDFIVINELYDMEPFWIPMDFYLKRHNEKLAIDRDLKIEDILNERN